MTTGMHVVQDVYCINCMTCVGWQVSGEMS